VDFHGGGDDTAGQIFMLHTLISFCLNLDVPDLLDYLDL